MHRCDRLVQAVALQLRNQAVRDCEKARRAEDEVKINKRQEALHKDLKKIGCDVAQGYYFSKPLFFDDLTTWLKQHGKV